MPRKKEEAFILITPAIAKRDFGWLCKNSDNKQNTGGEDAESKSDFGTQD